MLGGQFAVYGLPHLKLKRPRPQDLSFFEFFGGLEPVAPLPVTGRARDTHAAAPRQNNPCLGAAAIFTPPSGHGHGDRSRSRSVWLGRIAGKHHYVTAGILIQELLKLFPTWSTRSELEDDPVAAATVL